MKNRVSKGIAFILMMSLLPGVNVWAENDLTLIINPGESIEFNEDLFIKPGAENRVTQSYLNQMFYNGEDYNGTVVIDSVEYELFGDMTSRKDDVIKIDTTDVTVETEERATKKLGFIVFSREAEAKQADITLNFEGGKSQDFSILVEPMTNDNGSKSYNPIIVEKQGSRYVGVVDESKNAYLQSYVLDLSESADKNLNLQSVTLKAADFSYYLAAVTQIEFSADEVEEQTREAVRNYFNKYKDMNFYQVVNGENGATKEEVSELYSSLLKQAGKMEEATDENIEKIEYLLKSSELYSEFSRYLKVINESVLKYKDIPADFSELSETELTKDDSEKLSETVRMYEEYDNADIDSMNDAIKKYNLSETVDVTVDSKDREKIYALLKAYQNAELKSGLREEIEVYYNEYINKDISEITEQDYEKLEKLIEAFKKAEEKDIEFSEYNESYIKHLYNDYNSFKKSEDDICIDISSYYNVDIYANEGDSVNPEAWYECHDNLNGSYFKTAKHLNMKEFNNGFIGIKEFEYVKEETYDEATDVTTVKYPFTDTGRTITFYMPENCFDANVPDSVLFKGNSKESRTFKIDAGYSDKLFVVFTNLTTRMQFEPVIKYVDGTEKKASVMINYNGQIVHEVVNLKDKVYPDVISYVTSGNYKNQNLAKTGIIYSEEKNTTNGLVIVAIPLDNTKLVDTVTIEAAGSDFLIGALSLRPCANDVITDRVKRLYAEVVSEDEIVSYDTDTVAKLVLNYNEARKRGLYIEGISENLITELSELVLTGSLNVYRYNKDTVRAEVDFSVPVSEEGLESAIEITSDEKAVTNFRYELTEDNKKLILDIPVTRDGENNLSVTVNDSVKIKDNEDIQMVNSISTEYSVPAFIDAEYIDNYTLKLTNNSKTDQSYIAFAEIISDGEKIYKSVTGTVAAGDSVSSTIDTNLYLNPEIKISVAEKDTLAPLCELYEVRKTPSESEMSADYTLPTLDFNTDTVKIDGFTGSEIKDELVLCTVYSPDGKLIYAETVRENADGYFSFMARINQNDIPVSGNLKIRLGAESFRGVYENNEVYFPITADRVSIAEKIRTSGENELPEILKKALKELSLNFKPFTETVNDEKALAELSKRIYSVRKEIPTVSLADSESEKGRKLSLVQNIIKQQAVLLAIKNKKTELFSDGVNLLYNDVLLYSSVDSDGVTIYEIYNTEVSDEGKKEILRALSGNDYKNIRELLESFKKAVMLEGLKNPKNKGVGYVSAILTKENAEAINQDISKYLAYNNKTEAISHIANMDIFSLDDVLNYIDSLENNKKPTGNSSGSSAGGGGNSGGVGIIATSPIGEIKDITEDNKTETDKLYVDINENHWAYKSVSGLTEKNIINGKGDGRFCPDDNITRAEFVKMLCAAKGISTDEITDVFSDVKADDWYAKYVLAAFSAGIVKGISKTEFGPDKNITRQDMCTIIARFENIESEDELVFKDAASISEYARPAVGYLLNMGIIKGFEDNTFRPENYATRAEAATLIYNYLYR